MSVDIESVFKATAQSSWSFLITNGQGCYIPAYQRPFSWGADNVDRLFEDAIHGLHLLHKRSNTISFLGTIIAIHDTKHVTVQPIFKTEMPSKVMTIIDGQQRISTFLMINVAIHNLLCRWQEQTAKSSGAHFEWIREQVEKLVADLNDALFLDMRTGDKNHRYYPRIVRSYEDVWSKRDVQAVYRSPIARLLWEYFLHTKDKPGNLFRYNPKDENGNSDQHYSAVVDVFRYVVKCIKNIADWKDADNDFPELLGIVQNKSLCDAIWGFDLPNEVVEFVRDGVEDEEYGTFSNMLRLLVLSKYLNDRMAFTVVTAESEDDAFDMFEALNTTGEPLTAFETFKPKVIEAEEMAKYEKSPSFQFVGEIEAYLEKFKKAEEKQKATSEMLVPFALSETGEKLQKKLVDQRKYLRDQFDGADLSTLEEKREFVQRLSNLAKFMRTIWKGSKDEKISLRAGKKLDTETLVGLEVLKEINHHIVAAPLTRFFGEFEVASDDDVDAKFENFESAIRASIAFSVMWRAVYGGAAGIDTRYRQVLSDKIDNKYGPLAARPKGHVGSVSLPNYKKALKSILIDEGIADKKNWVKAVIRKPIYPQKTIARYLLFLASHDAVPDTAKPGLIKKGRKGTLPLLSIERWHDKDYLTVEHIAPQKSAGGWDGSIFDDPETVDLLGNLTLLPGAENGMVGNRSWKHKRLLYRLLSAETDEELVERKADCKKVGLTISRKGEEILKNATYLPLCKSLADKSDEWTLEFLNSRSKRLAELSWERLSVWLEL
ncbi:DUF262 domain-containing HNH endonuclease family protein [Ruegeria sp. HKCCA5929]|uniref:DUF262 domain-containing protein n=1 Tax=Ruegeria sp. HKCCA5929 TaxID=2682988 RepID=UPI001489EADA|nr:DUF262 domain-containing HNH endonuclease family protein [Ruegeria sp. HKCCA5929]